MVGKMAGSVLFRILVIVLLITVIFFVVGKMYRFGYGLFSQEAVDEAPGKEVKVLITENMSNDTVAKLFEQKGLVKDASVFGIQIRFFTSSSYKVMPGEYTLNTSMTPRELIKSICDEVEAETTEKEYLGLYD